MGWRRRGAGSSSGGGGVLAFVSVKLYGAKGDGITDDTAAIQSAMNSLAGTGVALWFPAASYLVASGPLIFPNGKELVLWGYGASLHLSGAGQSFVTPVGVPYVNGLVGFPTYSAFTAILNGAVTLGQNSISLSASPPVGSLIFVNSNPGNQGFGQCYKVQAVTGVGPYTVTLDRPTQQSYGAETQVVGIMSRPQDILVQGLSLVYDALAPAGGGARPIEILTGIRCHFVDVQVIQGLGGYTAPVADPACSIDEGSVDCSFERCSIQFPSNLYGFGTESSEHCWMSDCHSTGCGIFVADAVSFEIRDCYVSQYMLGASYAAGNALYIGTNGAYRSIGTRVYGGAYTVGYSSCIAVDAATKTAIAQCKADYGNGGGVEVVITGNALDTRFIGLTVDGMGTQQVSQGIVVEAGAVGTQFLGLSVTSFPSGVEPLVCSADTYIEDFSTVGQACTFIATLAGVNLTVDGFDYTPFTNSPCFGATSGSTITLRNGIVRFAQASSLFIDDESGGNTWIVDNVAMVGAHLGDAIGFRTLVAGSILRMGLNVDNLANTPFSFVAGTTCSMVQSGMMSDATAVGTVTLNGAQMQSKVIKATGNLTGNLQYLVQSGVQGVEYTLDTTGAILNGHTIKFSVVGSAAAVPNLGNAVHVIYSNGVDPNTVV